MDGSFSAPSEALTTAELADRITGLCGQLNAATYRWLVLIAEFDRREGWNDGALVVSARLPAETGALLLKALEAALDDLGPPDVSAETSSASQRRADALAAVAEGYLAGGPAALAGGERQQIVVHVDAEVLAARQAGRCELEEGPVLAAETVRRLCCDASLLRIAEDAKGQPLDVGRRTRSIPPALRRALESRDRG